VIRIAAIVAVALLIGGAVGFVLGREGDNAATTTIIERTDEAQPASRSDELREEFGIPTDEATCRKFGIPVDACP
jgi:hypothetical protein